MSKENPTFFEAFNAEPDPDDRSLGIDWQGLLINLVLWVGFAIFVLIGIADTRGWG